MEQPSRQGRRVGRGAQPTAPSSPSKALSVATTYSPDQPATARVRNVELEPDLPHHPRGISSATADQPEPDRRIADDVDRHAREPSGDSFPEHRVRLHGPRQHHRVRRQLPTRAMDGHEPRAP